MQLVMNAKFSIIIPVYNVALYLRECLGSVLSQSSSVEVICVDDGSTDGSGEILDEYAKADARVKVIHQDNAGVSAARNAGIEVATGGWLYFLDGDDVLIEGWLEKLTALVEGDKYDAFFLGRPIYFGKAIPKRIGGDGRVIMSLDSVQDGRKLFFTESLWGWPCIRLLRRSIFEDAKFPVNIANLEDSISLIDVLAHKARWLWVDWQIYGYRMRGGSACRTMTVERALNIIRAFTMMYDAALSKLGCRPKEARKILHQYRRHMGAYIVPAIREALVQDIVEIAKSYWEHELATGYKTAFWPVRMMLCFSQRFGTRRHMGILLWLNYWVDRIACGFERRLGIDADGGAWYWRALRKVKYG